MKNGTLEWITLRAAQSGISMGKINCWPVSSQHAITQEALQQSDFYLVHVWREGVLWDVFGLGSTLYEVNVADWLVENMMDQSVDGIVHVYRLALDANGHLIAGVRVYITEAD